MARSAKKKRAERQQKRQGPVKSTCGCGNTFICRAKNRDKVETCFCTKYDIHVGDRDACNGLCEECLKRLCGVKW